MLKLKMLLASLLGIVFITGIFTSCNPLTAATANGNVEGTSNLKWHTPPIYEYDDIKSIGWSGKWIVEKDGKYGAIDLNGNIVVPVENEYYFDCYYAHSIVWFVFKLNETDEDLNDEDSRKHFITYYGTVAVDLKETHDYNIFGCSHGGPVIYYWDLNNDKSFVQNMTAGYESFEKETIVENAYVTGENEYSELIWEKDANTKYGVSINDELIVPLEYDYIKRNNKGAVYSECFKNEDGEWERSELLKTYEPIHDIHAAKKDGKAGFMDIKGNVIVPFVFEETDTFNAEYAAVKLDGKWGFVYISE